MELLNLQTKKSSSSHNGCGRSSKKEKQKKTDTLAGKETSGASTKRKEIDLLSQGGRSSKWLSHGATESVVAFRDISTLPCDLFFCFFIFLLHRFLSPLSADAAGELHVFRHDGDALGVNRAQLSV